MDGTRVLDTVIWVKGSNPGRICGNHFTTDFDLIAHNGSQMLSRAHNDSQAVDL